MKRLEKQSTEQPKVGEANGWERFERAVDAAVKSGPKHRIAPKPHEEMKLGKSRGKETGEASRPKRHEPRKKGG